MTADLLAPDTVLNAATVTLDPLPLDPGDVVHGQPAAAFREVLDAYGVRVGIWELSRGIVTDTEADEVFVVVSGSAMVEFEGSDRILHLSAGSVGRLAAGSRTRWTVTETLRKVYLSPMPAAPAAGVSG
jgi:uncharacterized cupin superfamily protein